MSYQLPENFQPITPQRAFDAAWNAFVKGDAEPARLSSDAARNNGLCRYLTDDGRKCAIGLLIPDGHPAQQMHGFVWTLTAVFPDLFELTGDDVGLLADIQNGLHDNLANDTGWMYNREEREFIYRRFAERNKLKIPGEG